MNQESGPRKRSLILAGGGLIVAFQAGVLQVWLDEAGLQFEHIDAASGGVFNLAMLCQGMSGSQIAENWRTLPPALFVDFNFKQYLEQHCGESILTLDGFRQQIFPRWGLNWQNLQESKLNATFNVYNFSKHELEILLPKQMTEDYLIACVSLPMWFPPVEIRGDTYIDPVYVTDANIEEAIRRGADELWVIWTVSERGQWNPGFIAHYFQIIEASANGHFKAIIKRVEANNLAIATGGTGEFGREITIKLLKAEVPMHYLVNLSADRICESVNLGVQTARQWCQRQEVPLKIETSKTAEIFSTPSSVTTLCFTEEMKGYMAFGEVDYLAGLEKGITNDTSLLIHLTITIEDVHSFIVHPQHVASTEGYIECDALGGKLAIDNGSFNLFIDEGDPTCKKMLYHLHFSDMVGHPLTLSGYKIIHHDANFDVWHDTTTLFTRILRGKIPPEQEAEAEVAMAGIISIHDLDFLHQLTTFRTTAPTERERIGVLVEFGTFFLGKLWDVYGQKILAYGPF